MPILNSHSVIYSRVKPSSPYPVKAIPLCKERAQGERVRRGSHALLWPSWEGGSASLFSRRYLCLLCEKPLEQSPTVVTGMSLFFFTADCKSREYLAKEQIENADRRHQCMRKEKDVKNKSLLSIYTEWEIPFLYHHNPTYLARVRTDALPIRFFSQFCYSVDPREYFLSPDAHDLPHMPRRHFSPSPLHLADSFFQVILRRAVRVIWS